MVFLSIKELKNSASRWLQEHKDSHPLILPADDPLNLLVGWIGFYMENGLEIMEMWQIGVSSLREHNIDLDELRVWFEKDVYGQRKILASELIGKLHETRDILSLQRNF